MTNGCAHQAIIKLDNKRGACMDCAVFLYMPFWERLHPLNIEIDPAKAMLPQPSKPDESPK